MSTVAVVYETNGKIARICHGPKEGVELTVLEDGRSSIYVDEFVDMENNYVADNKVVAMPTKPGVNYTFNYDTKTWDYVLSEAKIEAWARIKQNKTLSEFDTFTWGGNEFQCDESSQNKIRGAVMRALLDSTISITWTLADNSAETFNATQLREIGKALEEHVNDCHVKAQGLRTQINAATDQAQLDAVSW